MIHEAYRLYFFLSMKKFTSLLLAVPLLLLFLWYSSTHIGWENIWDSTKNLSFIDVFIFILLSFLNFGLYTLRWKELINTPHISFWKLYQFRFVAHTISYFIPSAQVGGEPARIALAINHGAKKHATIAGTILDKVFELMTSIFTSIIGLLLILPSTDIFHPLPLAGGCAVLCLFGFFFYASIWGKGFFTSILQSMKLHHFSFGTKIFEELVHIETHIRHFFRHHPQSLFRVIIYSLGTFLLMLAEYYLIAHALGLTLSWKALILITALPLVGYLLPTPGGAGGLEGAQILAFSLAGISPAFALPTILVIRMRDSIFILFGISLTSHYGVSFFSKKPHVDNSAA